MFVMEEEMKTYGGILGRTKSTIFKKKRSIISQLRFSDFSFHFTVAN
jgi:hypothetical protein